jgi:hypothetical protein
MGLGQHQGKETAEGVADDGDWLKMVGDDVLVKLLDDGDEDWSGGIRASGFTGEACDLDKVEAIVWSEEPRLGGVDVAGAGEAGDKNDVGSFAARDSFDNYGEAGGGGCDGLAGWLCREWSCGLAEDRFFEQQEAREKKEKGGKAEGGA